MKPKELMGYLLPASRLVWRKPGIVCGSLFNTSDTAAGSCIFIFSPVMPAPHTAGTADWIGCTWYFAVSGLNTPVLSRLAGVAHDSLTAGLFCFGAYRSFLLRLVWSICVVLFGESEKRLY